MKLRKKKKKREAGEKENRQGNWKKKERRMGEGKKNRSEKEIVSEHARPLQRHYCGGLIKIRGNPLEADTSAPRGDLRQMN